MHVSVVEVHRKLDVVIDEIRREGAHTRAEISQDIKEEGKLTREAIQQTMVSLGKFPDGLSCHVSNTINMVYKKSVSGTPPMPDSTRTQGAMNV